MTPYPPVAVVALDLDGDRWQDIAFSTPQATEYDPETDETVELPGRYGVFLNAGSGTGRRFVGPTFHEFDAPP